jgi:hypothetical protein
MSIPSSVNNTLRADADEPQTQLAIRSDSEEKEPSAPSTDPPPANTQRGADDATATGPSQLGTVYPGPLKQACITFGLALGIFLYGLASSNGYQVACELTWAQDGTIIATAIPKITDEFGAFNDVGWYAAAYFMTSRYGGIDCGREAPADIAKCFSVGLRQDVYVVPHQGGLLYRTGPV